MAFKLTPESLGLMSGGLNMLAASRGGNPDMTKGGIGYALQQGLQGGLQGMQLGQQFEQQNKKQKMMDDMLMKLNLDPSAQQSTGVMRPSVQQSALANLTPEQKEVARMAIMSGDWKTIGNMLSPDQEMTPYQRESLDIQRQRLQQSGQESAQPTAGIKDFDYYQDLKKRDPDAAEAFGRERGYISSEGVELSSHLQKRLSASTDEAITSERNSSEFLVLADEIEKANIGGGAAQGKWAEGIKDFTGNQDAITDLRQKYMGIRSSQGIKNLPPGVASDKDIELALKGFPTENATGTQIASFLRGMAKLEDFNAKFNSFKAEYISDKGHERDMLKAWKDANKSSTGTAPEGVQPEVWAVMTPEEKAAWQ